MSARDTGCTYDELLDVIGDLQSDVAALEARIAMAARRWYREDGSVEYLDPTEVERRRKAGARVIAEARRIVEANWIATGPGSVGAPLAEALATLDAGAAR